LDPRNILIFRIGHLGDTVVALPALWAIRRRYPDARISLLTNVDQKNPNYISPADVLPPAGLIDKVLVYPTNLPGRSKAAAYIELALAIRREQFDGAFYLMPRVRTKEQIDRDRVFFRMAGVKKLIGYEFLLREKLELPISTPAPFVERESDFLLRLLDDAGINPNVIETDLILSDEEISAADRWLDQNGPVVDEQTIVAVAPGSKLASKMWPEARFIDVLSRLIERFDCHPIIFGGPEDHSRGERMITTIGRGANSAGKLSVRESAALLRRCGLYLGNDTGTMHLASAVGLPCVAIFSTTDWVGRWAPFGDHNRLFRGSDDISMNNSTEQVEADEVFEACVEVLSNK
jgi:heptosyltransferase-3